MSEEHEAEQIVTEIRDLVSRRGYDHENIAVLYRANSQSRAIEEAFARHGIPYRIESEASFYRRYEVAVLLHYLQLIHDPDTFDGDDALKAVINVPSRFIGRSFIEELEAWAESRALHLYPALKVMPIGASYLKVGVRAFTELIDDLAREKDWLEPAGLIDHLRLVLDFDKRLADEMAEPVDGPLECLDHLQMAAGRYDRLGEFLEYTESVRTIGGTDENGVTLSTVHKAKGLEFAAVFVIGMVEGIMPNVNGDIEEERRIAFVAMSRSMKLLYLSWPASYLGRPAVKSSFIGEALEKRQ